MKNTLQGNEDKGQNSKVYHFNNLISIVYINLYVQNHYKESTV